MNDFIENLKDNYLLYLMKLILLTIVVVIALVVLTDLQAYKSSNKLCKLEGYDGVYAYITEGMFNSDLVYVECIYNKYSCHNVVLNNDYLDCGDIDV